MRVTWTGLYESITVLEGYKRIPGAVNKAVAQEANLLRAMMVKGLRDQAPGGKPIKPLSVTTRMLRGLPSAKIGGAKKRRPRTETGRSLRAAGFAAPPTRRGRRKAPKRVKLGSSKALIDKGDLLRSIHVKKMGAASYTVGVHKGTRGKNGKDMSEIAAVHENGSKRYTITVTEKMRRFSLYLVSMGIMLAPWRVGQKLRKKTPARPFLGPAHEEWEFDAHLRFERTLKMLLPQVA